MLPQTPDEVPLAFTEAWMARDADALAALFAEDADFVNVVGIWWEDRPAIAKAHGYALRSFFAETKLVPGRIKTRMLGTDAALVHCRFRLTGQKTPDGGGADARSTILLFVVSRVETGWQVIAAQNTDIVPGAETQLNTGLLRPADYR